MGGISRWNVAKLCFWEFFGSIRIKFWLNAIESLVGMYFKTILNGTFIVPLMFLRLFHFR